MQAKLLLLDRDGGVSAELTNFEFAFGFEEADANSPRIVRVQVNGKVEGALVESVRTGVQVALRLLRRRGRHRASVERVSINTEPLPGSVIGESATLLFGIAAYIEMARHTAYDESVAAPRFAATGKLDDQGNVHAINGVADKVTTALETDLCGGGILFYPQDNHWEVDDALRARCVEQGLELWPVRHVYEALRRLGAVGPYQIVDATLQAYLEAVQSSLDYIEAPGDWSVAGRDPSQWRLTQLYWPTPVSLHRLGGPSSEVAPPREDVAPGVPERVVTRAEARGAAVGRDQGAGERFGSAFAHSRISVVGEQGVGKGCLLRHTAIAYALWLLGDDRAGAMLAIDTLPERPLLPVFIDVRDTRLDGTDCRDWELLLKDAIAQLGPGLGRPANEVLHAMQEWIRNDGEVLLIVDGLDEAPNKLCIRQIDDLALRMQRQAQVRFVRSARWSRGDMRPIEDVPFEVQLWRLEVAERRNFLLRLLQVAQVPEPASWADRAVDLIDELVDAPAMSRTPLFLSLLASNLPLLEDWRGRGGGLHEALLTAMFQRSRQGRRVADCAGWYLPLGQVALSMSILGEQQIKDGDLHRRVARAYGELSALPITQEVTARDYVGAMKASGLLRERRRSQRGLESAYDFGLDELRSWLVIMALDLPERASGQSDNETWANVIGQLKGEEGFRIAYDKHDLVRKALLLAPAGVASDYLDLVVRAGVEENISFAIRAMADGLAPRAPATLRLTRMIIDREEPSSADAVAELWARLRADGASPDAAPRPWARLIGLYAGSLPGLQKTDLTALHGFGWLQHEGLLDRIHLRLAGDDITEACATAYELMDWRFRLPAQALDAEPAAQIRRLAETLMTLIDLPDVRREFALWALRWLAQRAPFKAADFGLESVITPERVAAALLRGGLGDIALRNAASLLCLRHPSQADLLFDWATALEGGAQIGSLAPPTRMPANTSSLAVLRTVAPEARSDFTKGRIAAAAVIIGGDDPAEVAAAICHVAEHEQAGPIINALAALPVAIWLASLQPLLTASPDKRLRAVLLMLAFAPREEVAALRLSPSARDWPQDVLDDVDEHLAR